MALFTEKAESFKAVLIFSYIICFSSEMSTSQKLRNFVSEPIGDKSVNDLPGIGEVLGDRLKKKGYTNAYNVLGQFLLLNKDQELFCDWMKLTSSANAKQAMDCYTALNEWCSSYMY